MKRDVVGHSHRRTVLTIAVACLLVIEGQVVDAAAAWTASILSTKNPTLSPLSGGKGRVSGAGDRFRSRSLMPLMMAWSGSFDSGSMSSIGGNSSSGSRKNENDENSSRSISSSSTSSSGSETAIRPLTSGSSGIVMNGYTSIGVDKGMELEAITLGGTSISTMDIDAVPDMISDRFIVEGFEDNDVIQVDVSEYDRAKLSNDIGDNGVTAEVIPMVEEEEDDAALKDSEEKEVEIEIEAVVVNDVEESQDIGVEDATKDHFFLDDVEAAFEDDIEELKDEIEELEDEIEELEESPAPSNDITTPPTAEYRATYANSRSWSKDIMSMEQKRREIQEMEREKEKAAKKLAAAALLRNSNSTDRAGLSRQETIRGKLSSFFYEAPRINFARSLFEGFTAVKATAEEFIDPDEIIEKASKFLPYLPALYKTKTKRLKSPEKFSPPVALRKVFERLGPSYYQVGEYIATNPSIFPESYVNEFSKFAPEDLMSFEWSTMKEIIETEIGPSADTFSSIEEEPCEVTRTTQVYKANLINSEEKVLVKVRKPSNGIMLEEDLNFIVEATRAFGKIYRDKTFNILAAMEQMKVTMLEEIDLKNEALRIDEFKMFLEMSGQSKTATVPKVYRSLTTDKVLTLEYFDGNSLAERLAHARRFKEKDLCDALKQRTETALTIWMASICTMSWFQTNIRADNIFLLDDGRIVFTDFGSAIESSRSSSNAFFEMRQALFDKYYYGVTLSLINMSVWSKPEIDLRNINRAIEGLIEQIIMAKPESTDYGVKGRSKDDEKFGPIIIKRPTLTQLDDAEMKEFVNKVLEVVNGLGLKMPKEFSPFMLQSLYFEKYLKIIDLGVW
eukprot:CAMPEP_0116076730 /NCGR_PEP_ID=MMETSP0322-20121206/17452_1 /TAXON_ID=163516 /ORGANISM="Leptocylindrus danicus var. apora, Strain B651" /LENGTH=845 /DNA_ID=CAMNT_0003567131 /DNA_START=108 /DNA_END=2642 /DNA_ORIENTATION=-